jgi:hypothetical protein
MEAVIRITPAELTQELLDRVLALIGKAEGYEIELHVKNVNFAFYQKLDASIQEARDGKIIRFTPDQLEEYTNSRLG